MNATTHVRLVLGKPEDIAADGSTKARKATPCAPKHTKPPVHPGQASRLPVPWCSSTSLARQIQPWLYSPARAANLKQSVPSFSSLLADPYHHSSDGSATFDPILGGPSSQHSTNDDTSRDSFTPSSNSPMPRPDLDPERRAITTTRASEIPCTGCCEQRAMFISQGDDEPDPP
ncbi:hypothetical protein CCUS01_04010 [Colletotrichum cuscutae]|uniref:Uncharacterized protein n=1 Tax=Colletotrichum cuscutae TaxID=1209917 RepID=A0AAI9VGY6_9PEZI|nr:hypothetical protein CCUS01_04010 [Colletotrichum cuscutae]